MKMQIDADWLRKKTAEGDDPEGCPYCGAIAGACDNYPSCPWGDQSAKEPPAPEGQTK